MRITGRALNFIQKAVVELRLTLGFTQQALADALGLTKVTVARWETSRPPRGMALADLYRCALEAGRADLASVFERQLKEESDISIGVAMESSALEYAVRLAYRHRGSSPRALKRCLRVMRELSDAIEGLIDVREKQMQTPPIPPEEELYELLIEIQKMEQYEEQFDGPIQKKGNT